MPDDTIYVGRGTRWGNPYRISKNCDRLCLLSLFRRWVESQLRRDPAWLAPLRSHDLACWCPLDQPCHADVLLELANA